MKTMDAGCYEAALAFEAGADVVTVLGCAADETVRGAVREANRAGRSAAADLIAVPNQVERAQQLERLGVHYIGIHTGLDQQAAGDSPGSALRRVRSAVSTPLMVAGGITSTTVGTIAAFDPAIVVVGAAITMASDPVAASVDMHEALMSAAARRAAIAKFGATGWRRWTPRVRKVESVAGWRRSTPRGREGAPSERVHDRRVA
jgi:3-hexulose-6-phosphate synthase